MPDQFWQKNIKEMTDRYGEFDPKHIGPRAKFRTTEPILEGHGTSHMWVRVIYGWPYSFNLIEMPDGERRIVVSKYNGYCGGVRFACAWSSVRSYTYLPHGELRVTSPAEVKLYAHGYEDVLEDWGEEEREPNGPCMCGDYECQSCNPSYEAAGLDNMSSYGS